MLDKEENKMLVEVSEKTQKLIQKTLEKYSLDGAFFRFKLSVEVLGGEFTKIEERVLFKEDSSFCDFCGTETDYYDTKTMMHLCASCFAKTTQK